MSESDYYESAVEWGLDQHLEDADQLMRFQVTAAMISPRSESLLDLGTGNAAFLTFLEKAGRSLKLHGLERSRAAIAAAQCKAGITEGSIDALSFEDRSFDTVTALEVIEHLPHAVYRKALAEMARVAASQVLISVPYRERRLMVSCSECGCRFSPVFHLRTFDDEALDALVPGFRLARQEYVSTDVNWLLSDLATRFRGFRDRLKGRVPVPTSCPQCGYVMGESNSPSHTRPAPADTPVRRLRASLLALAPKVSRAHWVVASYERIP